MTFLARAIIISILSVYSGSLFDLRSQIRPEKKVNPATISGRVTIKGKGAAGIVVGLSAVNGRRIQNSSYRATTDQEGNYRISDVPPGSYQINPDAPAFVVSTQPRGANLIVNEGDSIDDVNFDLVKGAVITGRVANSEGQPLIEQEITLIPVETSNQNTLYVGVPHPNSVTDDRGVYRIFGVSLGKYKLAVGSEDANSFAGRRTQHRQTFYPNVTDSSKATILEVGEGGELTGVDIVVETVEPGTMFAVSGRIVDAVTGQPVPNLRIGLQLFSGYSAYSFSGSDYVSDQNGRFRVDNLVPGKYGLFGTPGPNRELRTEPLRFEIVDQDVTGLVVKTYRGASVSGEVVFEGINEKLGRTTSSQLMLRVFVNNENTAGNMGQSARVDRDSTFHVGGLPAGPLNFLIGLIGEAKTLSISRIERDGIILGRSFDIKEGEQITGLKLVVNVGSGTIRGVVKLQNGEIPPTAHISVWFTNTGADSKLSTHTPSPIVDSRGRFLAEGLLPGAYEINAAVYLQGGAHTRPPTTKQQVTVTDGGVTDVTLTIDLSPQPELR